MAYQNVGTPRFYVNAFEWLNRIGYFNIPDVFRMNPTNFKSYNFKDFGIPTGLFSDKAFIAILGHTFVSDGHSICPLQIMDGV